MQAAGTRGNGNKNGDIERWKDGNIMPEIAS